MSLGTFLFLTSELEKLDSRMAVLRGQDQIQRASTNKRIEALERDLGRVALATRALADLCIAKGLFTQEEFVRQVHDVDALDGVLDQRLQAKVVMPGESKPADPDPADDPEVRKERMKRQRPYP